MLVSHYIYLSSCMIPLVVLRFRYRYWILVRPMLLRGHHWESSRRRGSSRWQLPGHNTTRRYDPINSYRRPNYTVTYMIVHDTSRDDGKTTTLASVWRLFLPPGITSKHNNNLDRIGLDHTKQTRLNDDPVHNEWNYTYELSMAMYYLSIYI